MHECHLGEGGAQAIHIRPPCSYKYHVLGDHSMEAVMVALRAVPTNSNSTYTNILSYCGHVVCVCVCMCTRLFYEVPHNRNKCP